MSSVCNTVYLGYITQGGAVVALEGCYEPTYRPGASLFIHRFHDMFVYQSGLRREQGTKNETSAQHDPELWWSESFRFVSDIMPEQGTICFTICLFISPDLDGYRAPRGINPTRPTSDTRSRNDSRPYEPRASLGVLISCFFFRWNI